MMGLFTFMYPLRQPCCLEGAAPPIGRRKREYVWYLGGGRISVTSLPLSSATRVRLPVRASWNFSFSFRYRTSTSVVKSTKVKYYRRSLIRGLSRLRRPIGGSTCQGTWLPQGVQKCKQTHHRNASTQLRSFHNILVYGV